MFKNAKKIKAENLLKEIEVWLQHPDVKRYFQLCVSPEVQEYNKLIQTNPVVQKFINELFEGGLIENNHEILKIIKDKKNDDFWTIENFQE